MNWGRFFELGSLKIEKTIGINNANWSAKSEKVSDSDMRILSQSAICGVNAKSRIVIAPDIFMRVVLRFSETVSARNPQPKRDMES